MVSIWRRLQKVSLIQIKTGNRFDKHNFSELQYTMFIIGLIFIMGTSWCTTCASIHEVHPNQTPEFKNSSLIAVSPSSFLKTTTRQDVRFRCAPISFNYNVTWLKRNSTLPLNRTTFSDFGQVLILNNVAITDTGDYRCTVTNGTVSEERDIHLHVDAFPFWKVKPYDVILSSGDSGSTGCLAGGSPTPEITWLMNGQLVPAFQNTAIKERVYTYGNQLHIQNAKRDDIGVVTCIAKNMYGSISIDAYIIVTDLAPRLRVPMKDVEITEGRTAVFVCDVTGAPKPVFSWFINETSISPTQKYVFSGNTLTVKDVTKSDSGKYSCFANNVLGEIIVDALLIVRDKTTVFASPEVVSVDIDMSAVFRCGVTNNERLVQAVTWYNNGVAISKYDCNQNLFQNYDDNSLVFMRVQESHEGRYKCVAKTGFDEAEDEVTLLVKRHPEAPENVHINRIEDFKVEITWDPGFDGNAPTEHFVIQYLRNSPYNWAIKTFINPKKTNAVIRLEPWTNYKFRVVQVNRLGQSPPSMETQAFQTVASPPTRNPTNVEANVNEDGDLQITWNVITRGVNGPGFYYLLSWKGKGGAWESTWIPDSTIGTKSIHPKRTSEFYEVKVQSRNALGNGPEPSVYRTRT